ncbi:MAG: NusG domain II-containing protein [Lachnospiraceae bacterium]|nr:NusG domain II-containing protein [Lachnospiraceae bacterium]
MNKRDMILIIAVLIFGALAYICLDSNTVGGEADIYVRGELYGSYDLSATQTVHIEHDNGIINDIEISDGSIYMKYSNCIGKQCMHTGRISHNNESICCAPAGLIITVRSKEGSDYDAVTK